MAEPLGVVPPIVQADASKLSDKTRAIDAAVFKNGSRDACRAGIVA